MLIVKFACAPGELVPQLHISETNSIQTYSYCRVLRLPYVLTQYAIRTLVSNAKYPISRRIRISTFIPNLGNNNSLCLYTILKEFVCNATNWVQRIKSQNLQRPDMISTLYRARRRRPTSPQFVN
jgi:hypothetical protein